MSGSSAETPGAAPEPLSPAAPSGPGALLRQARERAGIGAEDLAGQLKIAKSTLEALERDDFAALSEPVYVRGYYRKIAKVLGVPESEVIAAYGARSQPAPATPAMRRIPLAGGVAAGTSRQYRGQGLWIAVGIAVVLALGFALTEREPARRLAAETPAPAPVAPAAVAPAPTAVTEPATGPDATGAVQEGSPGTVAPPATAAPEASTAPAPAAPAAAAAVSPTQLTLEFSAASFVRVEDSRQRTLAIGLVRGGERQALDGQPPYTVFLGNAQNVKVFYGGGAVDFSSHINRQNDTARFTVP
jgi:cytoskeleton protein RodZ